jgi:hypothetical protein
MSDQPRGCTRSRFEQGTRSNYMITFIEPVDLEVLVQARKLSRN